VVDHLFQEDHQEAHPAYQALQVRPRRGVVQLPGPYQEVHQEVRHHHWGDHQEDRQEDQREY